jgi:hypothetical protein
MPVEITARVAGDRAYPGSRPGRPERYDQQARSLVATARLRRTCIDLSPIGDRAFAWE